MSRDRRAAVKQADIARAIKALEAAGYKIGADRARLGVKSSRRIADQIANTVSPHPKSGAGIRAKSLAKSKAKK